MTTLIRGLQTDRAQRMIDLGVFGLGALSLVMALLATAAGLAIGPDDSAMLDHPVVIEARL